MSEQRAEYATITAEMVFTPDDWQYNLILRLQQAAKSGKMVLVDYDARCWYEVGKIECNKVDRTLPFRM